MKKVWVLCAVLLAGCSLSETEQKTEAKVRFDRVYPVELAHYEYEERLQTFYDAEEISSSQLGKLYKGEFPNGETAPSKLRIHWTNARALAQAEVELQKDILGWAGADVSPRPILINDKDEKFYRYYEYRILKGGKEIGAVRIPAYRRTENFATAEVHQYNGDASLYTVKPTGWHQPYNDRFIFSEESSFVKKIQSAINVGATDKIVTAYSLKILESIPYYSNYISESSIKNLDAQANRDIYTKVRGFSSESQIIGWLDQSGGDSEKSFILQGVENHVVSRDAFEVKKNIPNLVNILNKNILYSMASSPKIKEAIKEYITGINLTSYVSLYAVIVQAVPMALSKYESKDRSTFETIVHTYFWQDIERCISQQNLQFDTIVSSLTPLPTILDNENIEPILTYPQETFDNPNIINNVKLAESFTPAFSLFLSKSGVTIPLSNPITINSRARSVTRDERIKELNAEIAALMNSAAMLINQKTQKMNENMAAAFFSFNIDALFTGADVEIKIPYQIGFGPGSTNKPITVPGGPTMPTPGAGIDIGGTIGFFTTLIGAPATFGVTGAVAILYSMIMPGLMVKKIADTAIEERKTKVTEISASLKEIIGKAEQEFLDNGWAPLSDQDGYNIKSALDFYNNPDPAKQRKIVEDRLLAQLSITGNRWYIPGIYSGLMDHWSFGTSGKSGYTPIPIGAIIYSKAYVTRSILSLFRGNNSGNKGNQKQEYLKFLLNNGYEWEYNFFKNGGYK